VLEDIAALEHVRRQDRRVLLAREREEERPERLRELDDRRQRVGRLDRLDEAAGSR
jgi:hypothetical protein